MHVRGQKTAHRLLAFTIEGIRFSRFIELALETHSVLPITRHPRRYDELSSSLVRTCM